MNVDKQTGIIIAAMAVIIIVAGVLLLGGSDSPEDDVNEQLESQLNESVEEASEEKPHTAITNPEMVSGVSKVLGTSYHNLGFEECVEPGARLVLKCENLQVDYVSAPKEVDIESSELLVGEFNVTGKPGSYRCDFDIVCDNTTVASSSTSIKVLRQS